MTRTPSIDTKRYPSMGHMDIAIETLTWCLEHFAKLDESNAKIHCAPVRYSPLTFRIERALIAFGVDAKEHAVLAEVYAHDGAYEEDPGR